MDRWLRTDDLPGVVGEPAGASAPLSISQEESWYQAALQRDEPTYQEYDAVLIRGPVDPLAMERAVAALAERHDAFRIVYPLERGGPVMRYLERPVLPFTYLDARAAAAPDPRRYAEDYVRRAVRESFDLQAAPPAHAHLVRLADDLHVFVMVIFHIIKDGTTEGILARDLSQLYRWFLTGEAPELPVLPTTLGEHARWQRRLERAGAFDENVAFWAEHLRGAVPVDVPGDFPRPAILSDAGARTYRFYAPERVAKLRALAHAEDGSLFMILMSAFALLLHRYGRAGDVPIAFPVRNRSDRLRPMVGCFINTLIARERCDDALSFREHLRLTRETLITAYAHQDAPFSSVVQRLAPPRRPDQTTLASALLLLRNPRVERMDLPGCVCERMEIDVGIAKFDLTLEFDELPAGLRMGLEYRTTLFERITAERMLANFEALLDSVGAEPDVPFGALDALAPGERELVAAWSRGPERAASGTLVEGVLGAAAAANDAPAVLDGERTMTYGELCFAARRIARALGAGGRSPRTVAVYGGRSVERVAATLGTLFAGAAFLPIDAAYPADRVRFMLEDGAADAVLVPRAAAHDHDWPVPAIAIEDALAGEVSESAAAPSRDDAAYVMFTSGSTGRPNAVVVPHRAVANYVDAVRAACNLGPGDRVLQLTSPSFDISVEETFGALCSGAALAIPGAGVANAVSALLAECARLRVTVLDLPTAYFNELVPALESRTVTLPRALRAVIVGGELLTRERAAAFLAAAPGVRLFNGYGPTEAAIAVTFGEVTREQAARDVPLPLGPAVPNVRVALLGETLRPVPIGAAGEIAIGGIALADGYRARPELDAQRFARDPQTGERLYLTGDLGRFAPDGALRFLGRSDDQAKVNGYRLEPAEVEALLLAQSGVRDAAVFLDGAKRLVACVVIAGPSSTDELRPILARHLPAFAVPERIVAVPRIPLTANGKRDRRALEQLAARPTRKVKAIFHHLLSPVEQRLLTIWQDALGRDDIAIDDDFFALGGHSLLSARMFTRIEAELGVRLPLQTLFARPTIAAIANALESGIVEVTSLVTAHEAQRAGRPIFFVHGDFNGGGLYTRRLAKSLRVDRPLYALAPHGSIGDPIPPTIEAIADDYVRLIREVQPRGPYTLGGFCLGATVAIEIARRLRASGASVDPVLAVQPPTDVYVYAPLTAAANALARRFGGLDAASRAVHLSKGPWRGFEQLWRWGAKLVDPRRRRLAYSALTRRWNTYVVQRRFEPEPRFWGSDVGDALVRIVNRFVPARYPGPIVALWAFDSGAGPLAGLAIRRAAASAQVAYTPGSHISALNVYTDELADVLSDFLSAE
ncbi:MAG TPA: amino acid adenylation domain-containing protein [Candidatus Elarobacter sp.]|jgi:amino acid adenylation domain-containing protein|nr:amino acid adenylation domain-containing protein [Candidatus Elarobacter sp.]